MMSANIAIPGYLKLKEFRKKGYDFINYFHDSTNQILPCDLNYIVEVVM